MKELITEDQADQIVLALSIAVTLISLAVGLYLHTRSSGDKRKWLWAQAILSALVGPVIWCFWQVYNSIENEYGLDSLKALKINFFIAIGLGAVFFVLFFIAERKFNRSAPSAR